MDLVENNGRNNGIRVSAGSSYGDSTGNGDNAWANPTAFGTGSSFLFFENNRFNGSISNDCSHAGKQVFRYNTFTSSSVQTHEMENDGRGCRATEVYNNSFTGNLSDSANRFVAVGDRMGPQLVWGNQSTNMSNLIELANDRDNDPTHGFLVPPNGFGYCGIGSVSSTGSNWDGNASPTAGYPCIDTVGRGQSDQVSGFFPKKCDITTFPSGCSSFTGSWLHNKLEPNYEWLNQYQINANQNLVYYNTDPTNFVTNRDYYAYTRTWNGSAFTGTAFNGTVGTGSGLLSARPSTCTAGPGGTYGSSPTGSYGVAYWGTDTNTLYVCTATNTWTAVYTPYTYPHPLTLGSGTASSSAPTPPTNVKATVQ
jgi:hypothetical protein